MVQYIKEMHCFFSKSYIQIRNLQNVYFATVLSFLSPFSIEKVWFAKSARKKVLNHIQGQKLKLSKAKAFENRICKICLLLPNMLRLLNFNSNSFLSSRIICSACSLCISQLFWLKNLKTYRHTKLKCKFEFTQKGLLHV